MIRLHCLRVLRGLWMSKAIERFRVPADSYCTTIVPSSTSGSRQSILVRHRSVWSYIYFGFCLDSSFWITCLTIMGFLGAVIFFIIQWKYVDWTARKDFFDYCQAIQATNKSLSSACVRALVNPIPPPPFSPSRLLRRYLTPVPQTTEIFMVLGPCFVFLLTTLLLTLKSLVSKSSRNFWPHFIQRFALNTLKIRKHDEECAVARSNVLTPKDVDTDGRYTPLTDPEMEERPILRRREINGKVTRKVPPPSPNVEMNDRLYQTRISRFLSDTPSPPIIGTLERGGMQGTASEAIYTRLLEFEEIFF